MRIKFYSTKRLSTLLFSKTCFLFIIAATLLTQSLYAQHDGKGNDPLFHAYLDIKDAFVSGDAVTASIKAGYFLKVLNETDSNSISQGNRNALSKQSGSIAGFRDIKNQRESFQSLSANMYLVVKSSKLSVSPIYYAYCPMKKAYWLSSEAVIKNPYYGSSMLTCGKVEETLK